MSIDPDALDPGGPLPTDTLDTITVLRCAPSLVMAKTVSADSTVETLR